MSNPTKAVASPSKEGSPGSILIRGERLVTVTRDVDLKLLRFYEDNPRIYSLIRADGKTPTQDEIRDSLLTLDHVRELIQDITTNGGLIDPLIVRDGDFVVLEGNSRLAAYHFLASKDVLRWGRVRCTLLPADIKPQLIFPLLAQYHVKGKKDWAPYEKAGFVYRRFKHHKIDISVVAIEMGLTRDEAKHLVAVYEFMQAHGDGDRNHWSYYDELLKSRKIKRAREEVAGFDAFIVEEIKSERIGKAVDLRDKLPVICAANPKVLRRYMDGVHDFAEAHDVAVTAGGEHHALNRLSRFRKWLVEATTEEDLVDAPKAIRDRMQYELKEIEKKSKKLKDLLDAKKGAVA